MKKLITFSLWGHDPKYLIGAIKNAHLAPEIYPGWIVRFYVASDVPEHIVSALSFLDHVEIVRRTGTGGWTGLFWRFEAASEEDVEVMISRDTDSRLNEREATAVNEWLESDKGFHIMRDHPYHRFVVLGGMWGAKKGTVPQMKQLILEWNNQNNYGSDYVFFKEKVMPIVGDNVLVYDEFFGGKPFPSKRPGLDFVGQVYDENDEPNAGHREALQRATGRNE